ncbi:MAG: WD40/YVTN/BNR-like repeat-containing protein [Bryobacteraceae bacterium]
MRLWLSIAFSIGLAFGQSEPEAAPAPPPGLVFTGKPLRVPVTCGEEEIAQFGLACTAQEPCPVYLEIAAVEPVGTKIFLTGNFHTSDVTLASILLVSQDGGKTWTEPHRRIPAAGLEQIQFYDFETGWIAGQGLGALPRDPFFLITTDGGKTWRRRPVFSETRVATVEQFWFSSKTSGQLLLGLSQSGEGGRYGLFESMTGGESWMAREVSQSRPALKGARAPLADWRVRPDAATGSYRVERRQGEQWQLVASFLVNAGHCRAEEITLPDAPPSNEPPPLEAVEEIRLPPDRGPRR